ncbi:PREDICTED: kinase-interacting family protein-like [Camelina sativa]|uniref:Kinase-interacting family protein-like n=1 Tax=Camelina sativa TaxID=90675 RepID=A0ABM0X5G9_CAMSA|nr:PREDICTED: kinase-interacting family protein-like [Camelina sativa]
MDASQLPLPQLPSFSELESRMQVMRVSALEENQTGETFSQRAEWFYQRRPLLLSLCQDLYDGYATLLDRFDHSKLQNPKQLIPHDNDTDTDITSEVESILSFQQTMEVSICDKQKNIEELVSQLVSANSEKDIAKHELQRREQNLQEASKTIELLKKLVMLLEMEKEVAVEETANLGYKLTSLLEENRALATEALFMKKEAVRLARCVLKMRDEHFHKVCHLQNQIYTMQSSREAIYENVTPPSCFGLDSSKNKSKKRKMSETRSSEPGEKKRSKWLKRLNTINPFTKY